MLLRIVLAEALSEALERMLALRPPPVPEAAARRLAGRTLVTGVGLSAGPARLLARALEAEGRWARFVPLSGLEDAPRADTCVLFSQGMGDNTELAIRAPAPTRLAFTGVEPEAETPAGARLRRFLGDEGEVVPVPAEDHALPGLLRLHSPYWGAARALECVGPAPADLHSSTGLAADRLRDRLAPRHLDAAAQHLVLVAYGRPAESLHAASWMWTEGALRGPPTCVEALELAHGPLQALHGRGALYVSVGPAPEALVGRVERCLGSAPHLRLPSTLAAPWDALESYVAMAALLVETLRRHPELGTSTLPPGSDAPLYGYRGELTDG